MEYTFCTTNIMYYCHYAYLCNLIFISGFIYLFICCCDFVFPSWTWENLSNSLFTFCSLVYTGRLRGFCIISLLFNHFSLTKMLILYTTQESCVKHSYHPCDTSGSGSDTWRNPLGSFSLRTSRQYSIMPVVWRSFMVQWVIWSRTTWSQTTQAIITRLNRGL